MLQLTPLHLAIRDKLGWGDMLAEIARPAIDRIINNFAGTINDIYGVPVDSIQDGNGFSESFSRSILDLNGDQLFRFLLIASAEDGYNEDLDAFLKCRNLIEDDMFQGVPYNIAIIANFVYSLN